MRSLENPLRHEGPHVIPAGAKIVAAKRLRPSSGAISRTFAQSDTNDSNPVRATPLWGELTICRYQPAVCAGVGSRRCFQFVPGVEGVHMKHGAGIPCKEPEILQPK